MAPVPSPTAGSSAEDVLFGQIVRDAHRWLENERDPAVVHWLDQQDARARAALDALPDRDAFAQRLKELVYVERKGVPR